MLSLNLARLVAVVVFICPPVAQAANKWRRVPGEPACFKGGIGGWELRLDATRARLVSAVPPGGSAADNVLLADGHRVWLGPQSEWPGFWPPPRDWEGSPATGVAVSEDATEVTFTLPHTDPLNPPLTRRYKILPDALLLVAAWRVGSAAPPAAARQAVHILQTRTDTIVYLEKRPLRSVPLGYGLLALSDRPGPLLDAPLPRDIATLYSRKEPDLLRLAFSGREEKIGVAPQPIVARVFGGYEFRFFPVVHNGIPTSPADDPDAGLRTQAYFGSDNWAMVELEQLSSRLAPATGEGWIEATARLEFFPIKQESNSDRLSRGGHGLRRRGIGPGY